ncbi:MAG: hypothetical protein Q9218_007890 [Villophora microphyllina]
MYVAASIVALTGLFSHGLAAPNAVPIEERALQNKCNQDNLLRSMIDPRYSAAASTFCSTYIQPTVTATTTVTTTPAAAKVKHLNTYGQYLAVGVTKDGYGGSTYAFTVTDSAASSYVEVDITQTLTLCPNRDYNFAAEFFETDAMDGPQTYVQAFINGQRIATSTAADAHTPKVYEPLSGRFTATSDTVTLTIKFIATDYLGVTWGLDDVVVTPA